MPSRFSSQERNCMPPGLGYAQRISLSTMYSLFAITRSVKECSIVSPRCPMFSLSSFATVGQIAFGSRVFEVRRKGLLSTHWLYGGAISHSKLIRLIYVHRVCLGGCLLSHLCDEEIGMDSWVLGCWQEARNLDSDALNQRMFTRSL